MITINRDSLTSIFIKLDAFLKSKNKEKEESTGIPEFCQVTIKLLGQSAVIAAQPSFPVLTTKDVDCYISAANHKADWIKIKLNQLFKEIDMEYDFLSDEIKMPATTEYIELFTGDIVTVYYAKIEYVLASKLRFSPQKNLFLAEQYLASSEANPDLLEKICADYGVDLAKILKANDGNTDKD